MGVLLRYTSLSQCSGIDSVAARTDDLTAPLNKYICLMRHRGHTTNSKKKKKSKKNCAATTTQPKVYKL